MIAGQGLDVLVYTDIGMDPFTYALAFSRLAPVQCATWGQPSTTGIAALDYFLSAEALECEGAEGRYAERLVRLADPAVYYFRPQLTGTPPARGAFGLPEGGTLYLCPQSLFKLHPDFDAILGGILRRDPTGYLALLQGPHSTWTERLRQQMASTLPDVRDRIYLVRRLIREDFLRLNAVADVLLDPVHFGGGNTSYEGLALGVPIVTLPSGLLRGRITYALYRQMGVLDCVAGSPEEYVDLAVRLGRERDYREAVRARIRAASGVLYENDAGVRQLEAFFRQAVVRAWEGLP